MRSSSARVSAPSPHTASASHQSSHARGPLAIRPPVRASVPGWYSCASERSKRPLNTLTPSIAELIEFRHRAHVGRLSERPPEHFRNRSPCHRPCLDSSIVALRDLDVTLTGAAGAVEILRGIDLEMAAGETVSVVGPSGAGKTTLLMIIGGLERPTGGRATVAGHDLGTLDEDELAQFRGRHVGIVLPVLPPHPHHDRNRERGRAPGARG